MSKLLFAPTVALIALLHPIVDSTVWAQSADYRFVHSESVLQDRIAYLAVLLEADPAVRTALKNDANLEAVGRRLRDTRESVFAACHDTTVCRVDALMLSPKEIEQVGTALGKLASAGTPMSAMVRDQMRPSGRFQKYADLDDAALLRAAWGDTANAINRLYRVYGNEQSYKMPNDGPGDGSDASSGLDAALSAEIDGAGDEVFLSPWSRLGIDLLLVNQRDEAARYEPLESSANAAAFAKAKGVDWKAHPYTAILVPGVGLGASETGLSPSGRFLVRMAAKRWREGLAPFVIVSGGHVHPDRTPYDEAMEMKRELLGHYHLPESAVVVDPYARHTTTNLRNAARLLFYMHAPMDREFLITTSGQAAAYIGSQAFFERCAKELGYQPAPITAHVSRFDLRARPNVVSLHVDPLDPLDP